MSFTSRCIPSMRISMIAGIVAASLAAIAPAGAGYEDQAAQTKAYAIKVLEFYKANGLEAAKSAFNTDKAWLLGPEHYHAHVSCFGKDQIIWADSGFPEVIGLSYNDLVDFDGVPLSKSVLGALEKSPSGASIQLRFANPVTKAVAHTEGFCFNPDKDNVVCAWSQSN